MAASARQHSARAVDVIHAPAAEPGAARLLLAPEIIEGADHRRVLAREPKLRERLDDMGRHVSGRRIEQLAEIAERDLGQDLLVVVLIESAPATAAALHGDQPIDAELDRLLNTLRLPLRIVAERRQGDQRNGGVVDVGVRIVRVFERPGAGLHIGKLQRPSPGTRTCRSSSHCAAVSISLG